MLNHVWQSTVFVAAAWLLTLALGNNRAALRFRIWFAASVKFLVPFAALVAIGRQIEWKPAVGAAPVQVTRAIGQVTSPFAEPELTVRRSVAREDESNWPRVLFVLWFAGASVTAVAWIRQWRRARAALRCAVPRGEIQGIRVMETASRLEPGIFGIVRPVLLLPQGMEARLSAEQIRAVIAHEMEHVRRRDNFTSFIHMMVETIFWFHPVVWMIRWKLAEERERACDEAVLRESVEPEVYAEGILNVCKFYVESRLACVSGVSGSNLRGRIEAILSARVIHLSFAKRVMVAAAAVVAIAGPLFFGLINVDTLRAEEKYSFDVASVKPNKTDSRQIGYNFERGRLVANNVPLTMLVAIAYNIPFQGARLTTIPDWPQGERFDVEGKADLPGLEGKAREMRMRQMLQTLLAERFHLVLKRESKEMPIYALVVAKNGPKLTKSKLEEKDCTEGAQCHVINGGMGRGLHFKAADMEDVTLFVSNWTDRPLMDRTGLAGLYELDTEGWAPMLPRPPRPDGPNAEDATMSDPSRPTLAMIFDRLGLRMEAQRGPVEIFTIEKAERPSVN